MTAYRTMESDPGRQQNDALAAHLDELARQHVAQAAVATPPPSNVTTSDVSLGPDGQMVESAPTTLPVLPPQGTGVYAAGQGPYAPPQQPPAALHSAIPVTNQDPPTAGAEVPHTGIGSVGHAASLGMLPTSPAYKAMQQLGMFGGRQMAHDERGLMAANEAAQKANNALAVQQAEVAQKQAVEMQQAQAVAAKADEAQAANNNAQSSYMAQQQQQMDGMVAQLQNSKIDPDHYWNSRSTGDKVRAGIATILAGIGAGLSGQHNNVVMDQIHNAIDKDIAAQHADHDNLRSAIGAKQSLVGLARQNFADKTQQTAAAKIAALDNVQRKVDTLAMFAKGPEAAARAQALNAKLEQDKAEQMQKLHQIGFQQSAQLLGQMGNMEAQHEAHVATQQAAAAKAAQVAPGIEGYEGVLPKGKGAVLVGRMIGDHRNITAQLAELRRLHDAHGGVSGKLGGANAAELDARAVNLRHEMQAAYGMSEAQADALLPSPTSAGFNKKRYETLADILKHKHTAQVSGFGLRPREGAIASFAPSGGGEESGEASGADDEAAE